MTVTTNRVTGFVIRCLNLAGRDRCVACHKILHIRAAVELLENPWQFTPGRYHQECLPRIFRQS